MPRYLAEMLAGIVVVAGICVVVLLLATSSSSHHGHGASGSSGGRVAVGGLHCVYSSQSISQLQQFERLTGQNVDCAELFNNGASSWSQWDDPFFLAAQPADISWAHWVAANPGRQLTVTQALIPESLRGSDWLTQGSAGHFAGYARTLAHNLVAAGLGNVIIRLSPEANGTWEQDSLPDTAAGLAQWRSLWRQTVEAMRSVQGAHFKFDWTINALERPVPLTSFYPGDDVVNIIGIDAYEQVPSNSEWQHLLTGTDGLDALAQFARAHSKPLSIPEWGAAPSSSAARQQYLSGIARFLAGSDVAYESYFYAHQYRSALAQGTDGLRTYRADFANS